MSYSFELFNSALNAAKSALRTARNDKERSKAQAWINQIVTVSNDAMAKHNAEQKAEEAQMLLRGERLREKLAARKALEQLGYLKGTK